MTDDLAADAVDDVVDKDVAADKAAVDAPADAKDKAVDAPAPDASADAADKAADADKDKPAEGDKAPEFPENWRELAAAGDEDMAKMLARYGSFKAVAKALKEAKDTIRSGVKEPAQPDPKDEKAMAEWRKAKGIPDDPTGYTLPETVTKRLTDEDKPIIASFTEFAHGKHARPDVVTIATEWYADMAEQAEAKRVAEDNSASEAAEEQLRETWGNGEYKGNLTLGHRYMESIPGVGAKFSEFRGPDGKRLGDIPEFIEWASDMGREKFGDVVFATSESTAQIANRKAEIEKIMKTDMAAYWKDSAMQNEYQQILAKEEKRK